MLYQRCSHLPSPSQESYAMLHKYELSVAKEEADKVDTVRYAWEKLLSRSTEVQNELLALQPNFRGELLSNVQTFMEDCQHFYQDYEKVQDKQSRAHIWIMSESCCPMISSIDCPRTSSLHR